MSVPSTSLRLLQRALAGGAVAWAAALPVAALVAAQPQPGVVAYLFAFAVYATGAAVCHQIDGRSFHLWQHQLPVCARCTGIYAGAALAALAAIASGRGESPPGRARLHPRWVVGLAVVPAAATLVFEWTTGVTPSNLTRAATGVVLGAAVGWLIVRGSRLR